MPSTEARAMTVQVSKVISAPVEKVYKAWTDPDQLSQWFGCSRVSSLRVEQDLRVGGNYKMEVTMCDADKMKLVYGTYKEIIPNKKLIFTWSNSSEEFPAKDTLVTVDFIAKNGATEVVIKHTNFKVEAACEGHRNGWTECLEDLDKFVA